MMEQYFHTEFTNKWYQTMLLLQSKINKNSCNSISFWRNLLLNENATTDIIMNNIFNYARKIMEIDDTINDLDNLLHLFSQYSGYEYDHHYLGDYDHYCFTNMIGKIANIETIEANPQIDWFHSGITQNPNLTIDYLKNFGKNRHHNNMLHMNPNLTIEIILENQHEKWNWSEIFARREKLMANATKPQKQQLDYIFKKQCQSILENYETETSNYFSIDFILNNCKHNYYKWDWDEIITKNHMIKKFIHGEPIKPFYIGEQITAWDENNQRNYYEYVIATDIALSKPCVIFDKYRLCKNTDFIMEVINLLQSTDIQKHPLLNNKVLLQICEIDLKTTKQERLNAFCDAMNTYNKSVKPCVSISTMLQIPFNWDWKQFFEMGNITQKTIAEFPNIKWNYRQLSENPNLTLDMVLNIDGDWNCDKICAHPFKNNRDDYVKKMCMTMLFATILEHYENPNNCYGLKTGDFILSNSYLVEMIVKYE